MDETELFYRLQLDHSLATKLLKRKKKKIVRQRKTYHFVTMRMVKGKSFMDYR